MAAGAGVGAGTAVGGASGCAGLVGAGDAGDAGAGANVFAAVVSVTVSTGLGVGSEVAGSGVVAVGVDLGLSVGGGLVTGASGKSGGGDFSGAGVTGGGGFGIAACFCGVTDVCKLTWIRSSSSSSSDTSARLSLAH